MAKICHRFRWLVLYGDATSARVILASTAAIWSFMLFLPGDTFTRPIYAGMAVVAPEEVWATAWALYALSLLWRTFSDSSHRLWLTITINTIGVLLYGTEASCIILVHIWPAPAAMAADIVLCLVAIWLLMRSGLNNPPGWRSD